MKQVLIASLITLASLTASAQPIHLKPGSSIIINGDVVSCEAPLTDPATTPVCSIKQDGYYYRVYSGSTLAETFGSFENAIEGVKKMKQAGLCR